LLIDFVALQLLTSTPNRSRQPAQGRAKCGTLNLFFGFIGVSMKEILTDGLEEYGFI